MFLKKNAVCDIIDVYVNTEVKACFKTPEVPFQSNQEWYATFTGEDGSRYAVTLEDENTLALKVYLDGQESYLSLVNTVYFARQEGMG